jgi:hypothetical protein
MNQGRPLAEAEAKAAALEKQIRMLVQRETIPGKPPN